MSHSLAKKFDKIVAKLGHKSKETKAIDNETIDNQENQDDASNDGGGESFLQRIKGHTQGKGDHHQQTDGIPPPHAIIEDLKGSPFKGKRSYSHLSVRVNSNKMIVSANYLKIDAHIDL